MVNKMNIANNIAILPCINTDTIIFCILYSTIIFLCSYLYWLSYRTQFLIPVIRSTQDNWFNKYNKESKRVKNAVAKMKLGTINKRYKKRVNNRENSLGGKYSDTKKKAFSSTVCKQVDLPFLSVIVPARNEEQFIERCITSLLNQDYPKFEIIVVDDDSTDNTLKLLKDVQKGANNILSYRELLETKKTMSTSVASAKSEVSTEPMSKRDRLKIISLSEKPLNWMGKTWASQNGFLKSKGDLVLFTDADTYYSKKDTLLQAVLYMQREKLDVLTGIPTSEKLTNFWSKITIPMWDFVSLLFGVGSVVEVNNPKSKIAYLMGSFFLIKRKVLLNVGTFESVREAIQEDKALGIIIKEKGYKLQIVKLKDMVYTTWADDLQTLWHGIGRTISPLVMKNKFRVIINLLIIFFGCIWPFVLFPFTFFTAIPYIIPYLSSKIYEIPSHTQFYLPILNLIACLFVFLFSSIKRSERDIPTRFTIWTPIGLLFVFIAMSYNIIPLLIYGNTKPIKWQGRSYVFDKKQQGFAL